MTGFLDGLTARARGTSEAIAPRIATRFEPAARAEEPFIVVPAEPVAACASTPTSPIERRSEPSLAPGVEPHPSLESRFAAIDRALRALSPPALRVEEAPRHSLPAQHVIERHTERVETVSPPQTQQATHHHTTVAPGERHHHTTVAPRETRIVPAATPTAAEKTAADPAVVHREIVRETQERIVAAPRIDREPIVRQSKTIERERVQHERVERERVTHERVVQERQRVEPIVRSSAAPPARAILATSPPPAPRHADAAAPSIHISIGRIDVRAQTTPERRAASSPPSSRPSLDDYVQRREGRRR